MGRAVDHQPLDLMEHRRMRRVVVAAEGAARHDDPDRRLLRQHGADLHRRGVGAQHEPAAVGALGQIEGVVLLARRVLGRDVERGEIVEILLDMRPLGDDKPHLAKDRDDLVDGLADRMDAALLGERHRQRDVGALGGEPRVQRARPSRWRLRAYAAMISSLAAFSAAPARAAPRGRACRARAALVKPSVAAEDRDAHGFRVISRRCGRECFPPFLALPIQIFHFAYFRMVGWQCQSDDGVKRGRMLRPLWSWHRVAGPQRIGTPVNRATCGDPLSLSSLRQRCGPPPALARDEPLVPHAGRGLG